MPSVISKRFAALAFLSGMLLGGVLLFFGIGREEAVDQPALLAFAPQQEEKATLVFVGDMMFDRHIRSVLEARGAEHVLGSVAPLLRESDLTVGNLEGPVTEYPSVSQGSKVGDITNMRFTFATSVPQMLASYGFDLVSLGNNHMLDFGGEGALATKQWLTNAGLSFVGDPTEMTPEAVTKEVNGIQVAFIGYNDFFGRTADETRSFIRSTKALEQPDQIVVLAHWGAEYLPEPPERVRELGRSFVDAGADLVIGSHPHVVQPYEDYRGARIYYSLGNFVFDQYWTETVRCGELVTVSLEKTDGATLASYSETEVGMRTDGSTALGCI